MFSHGMRVPLSPYPRLSLYRHYIDIEAADVRYSSCLLLSAKQSTPVRDERKTVYDMMDEASGYNTVHFISRISKGRPDRYNVEVEMRRVVRYKELE
jgi:hypothetical protein